MISSNLGIFEGQLKKNIILRVAEVDEIYEYFLMVLAPYFLCTLLFSVIYVTTLIVVIFLN